jgi:hypothetical protein
MISALFAYFRRRRPATDCVIALNHLSFLDGPYGDRYYYYVTSASLKETGRERTF